MTMTRLPDQSTGLLVTALLGLAVIAAPPATEQAEAQEADTRQKQARVIKVKILGMSCRFCAKSASEKLKQTVESAGFQAAGIIRSFASEHEDWHPEEFPEKERFGPVGERKEPALSN